MSIEKNTTILLVTIIAFGIFISWATFAQAVAPCLSVAMTSFGGGGKPATFTINNSLTYGCGPRTVSMCSYRVYIRKPLEGWGSTQTLFDHKTIVLQSGESKTISVNTDVCQNQIDAFEGECPDFSKPYDGKMIIGGEINSTMELCTKCVDECSEGQRVCDGNGVKECRKSADGCFKWSPKTDCEPDKKCEAGICIKSCTDECSAGQHICVGNAWKECGNFDGDTCREWGPLTDCGINKTCNNGSCTNNVPTISLRANGTVACNRNATLVWTSTNADLCVASGNWSGNKMISGSESIGSFVGSKTFILTCNNDDKSASDSVTLNGSDDKLSVNAGPDMEVNAGESTRFEGSVSNFDGGGQINTSWSCTGGSLSNRTSLRPTFTANSDNYSNDRVYTCTLTASDECGSDSDSMKITVNRKISNFDLSLTAQPQSGCAPLNNVSLKATINNFGDNRNDDYIYYFDCDNDGDWEKTATSDNTSFSATNLCDYRNVGAYTAKAKVTSNGRTVTDTVTINATDCRQEGRANIIKTVKNISRQTGYQSSVFASPNDEVSYSIVITGTSGDAENVFVTDTIPNGIIKVRDFRIDGATVSNNLVSGINIGSLSNGQTKTITYNATVAPTNNFSYGQTTMTNVATLTLNGSSSNSSAAVIVQRSAVLGATTVSTGVGGNMFAGLGTILAGVIICAGWMIKKQFSKR